MQLADFILNNIEPILVEWVAFARSVWPGPPPDLKALRDHGEGILRATVRDMNSAQTATQQSDKSKGDGLDGDHSLRVDGMSDVHAIGRVHSGFDLMTVVAEYRALRASVIRLWRESAPLPHLRDLEELTRFNESIDQSLTEAVRSFTEHVDHSRQMFLGILGHDLRNPLNAVMLMAQVMAMEAGGNAEVSNAASRITASAAAMSNMISDLLDFTGTRLGASMPLSPGPMELTSLCEEVVNEMRAAHPNRTIRFEAQGDLAGEWDSARVRQVLSNLIGNALQHGVEDGPVYLSASGNGSDVRLAVRNTGTPIPPDVLPTIFDPLVRGQSPDSAKQRRAGSIGLGLYIAREIILAHGGAIDVKSSAEAGTTFTVRLPRKRSNEK
jgi:signal transduction histidine kinase